MMSNNMTEAQKIREMRMWGFSQADIREEIERIRRATARKEAR